MPTDHSSVSWYNCAWTRREASSHVKLPSTLFWCSARVTTYLWNPSFRSSCVTVASWQAAHTSKINTKQTSNGVYSIAHIIITWAHNFNKWSRIIYERILCKTSHSKRETVFQFSTTTSCFVSRTPSSGYHEGWSISLFSPVEQLSKACFCFYWGVCNNPQFPPPQPPFQVWFLISYFCISPCKIQILTLNIVLQPFLSLFFPLFPQDFPFRSETPAVLWTTSVSAWAET